MSVATNTALGSWLRTGRACTHEFRNKKKKKRAFTLRFVRAAISPDRLSIVTETTIRASLRAGRAWQNELRKARNKKMRFLQSLSDRQAPSWLQTAPLNSPSVYKKKKNNQLCVESRCLNCHKTKQNKNQTAQKKKSENRKIKPFQQLGVQCHTAHIVLHQQRICGTDRCR